MKRLSFLFLFIILFSCGKQSGEAVVARVGDYALTAAEFRDRANYSPLPAGKNPQSYKNEVLQALIAEKMLGALKEHNDEAIEIFSRRREKEAVIESFWRGEIESKIKSDDNDLWQLYLKMNRQRDVEILSTANETEGQMLTRAWIENPQSVRHRLQRDTLQYSGELPVLEDTLFSAPMGKKIGPLKIGRRYITFRVRQEWPLYIVSRGDFLQKRRSLLKSWRRLQKEKLFARYLKERFPQKPYRLNKDVFRRMTTFLLEETLGEDEAPPRKKLTTLMNGDRELLREEVIAFNEGKPWTVATLLRELFAAPYPLSYKSESAFKFSLIKTARRLLDDELIYREALARGYGNTSFVHWQMAMWHSAYRAQKNRRLLPRDTYKRKVFLDSLQNRIPVTIYQNVLDTLRINPTRMMVLKKHFPGQTIVPPLFTIGNP